MKCSRCGLTFVGTSTEKADAPRTPVPSNVEGAAPKPHGAEHATTTGKKRRKTSTKSIILLIVGVFGVLGIVVMLAMAYYRQTHPIMVRDAKTGNVIEQERTTLDKAERRIKKHRNAAGDKHATPGMNEGNDRTDSQTPVTEGDPKLRVRWEIIKTGIAETPYACGSVHNTYTVPQKQVTIIAYINGARGPSKTYRFVPTEKAIRYSICLQGQRATEENVKVVATGEPADKDTIVLSVDSDQMNYREQNDKAVWTGTVRNRSSVPIKDVKIYCDFFDSDGIQGNKQDVIGKLVSTRTIGAGKFARFRVEFGALGATDLYDTVVARAAGQKY
jgi:isochorismate hydrolase